MLDHDDAIDSDPIDRLITDGLWLVVERDDGGRLRARAVPRRTERERRRDPDDDRDR